MTKSSIVMYVYDDATVELAADPVAAADHVAKIAKSLFEKGYVENLSKSSERRRVFCSVESLVKKRRSSSRKLKSVKRLDVEHSAKPLAKAGDLSWNEDELANRLAGLLPFNRPAKLQPTNEEMFNGMVVSQAEADKAANSFDNKFVDFFKEVQKPINELKKFASEEEELAYWSSIGTSSSASDSVD